MSLDCVEVGPVATGCDDHPKPAGGMELDRMLRSHLKRGAGDHMRAVDLRVLLGRLPDESISNVSEMLSIKPSRVRTFLRGEAFLQKSQAERVELLLEVVRVVSQVLDSSAISSWLDTEIPVLGDSARELLKHGRGADVREHVGGYLNTEYS